MDRWRCRVDICELDPSGSKWGLKSISCKYISDSSDSISFWHFLGGGVQRETVRCREIFVAFVGLLEDTNIKISKSGFYRFENETSFDMSWLKLKRKIMKNVFSVTFGNYHKMNSLFARSEGESTHLDCPTR